MFFFNAAKIPPHCAKKRASFKKYSRTGFYYSRRFFLFSATSPSVFFCSCRPCRGQTHGSLLPQTTSASLPYLGLLGFRPSGTRAGNQHSREYSASLESKTLPFFAATLPHLPSSSDLIPPTFYLLPSTSYFYLFYDRREIFISSIFYNQSCAASRCNSLIFAAISDGSSTFSHRPRERICARKSLVGCRFTSKST